jgi:hypothetical protein
MSTNTQTIRVRILPGIRMWQLLVVAAAIVASLMLGLLIGRSGVPANAATTVGSRDFSRYACTSHVPNTACTQTVEVGYVTTGHVPPGGYPSADH